MLTRILRKLQSLARAKLDLAGSIANPRGDDDRAHAVRPLTALATHRRWRIASLFTLYAAQGAPEGLLYVAIPAWLAAQGVSAAAIGSYLAIILLPWSFKLINGVLMDRFTVASMGRRRPWITAAQLCLTAALIAFALGVAATPDLVFLTSVGFVINLAAAFQDVAIDGMAIDIVPESERGQANGVMWGGKTLGLAASSSLSAALITWSGPATAALAIAAFAAIAMVFPLLLRERPGERLAPWSQGQAHPDGAPANPPRLFDLFAQLIGAFLKPGPALFAFAILVAFCAYGLKSAFAPVLAVQNLGWTQLDFGQLAGGANLAGGLFGIFLSGFIADRVGPHRAIVIALACLATLHGAMALAPALWSTPEVFASYYVAHAFFFVLLSVSVYARAMNLARPAIAATHFAAFMAVLNLGTSFGAQQLGWLQARWDYPGVFAAAAACCVAAIIVFQAADLLSADKKAA